ncbi:PLP-dependent aminotransferase family protein [Micromonospora sp. NPDC050980]|uniref:aminotransferase-like domain-containing protein n=1 Tax=Micromonospora sp. NPDC050980 TaxID=3155161 RepID=UPI0033E9796C
MEADRPDPIDLGIGQPEDAVLPRALLRRAAEHRLSLPDNSYLQYGPEEGSASLRAALSEFLTRHYGTAVHARELLLTSGASHALDLILASRTSPGDLVMVETPTYFFGLDILRSRRLRIVPVPMDAEGLDVAALERMLHEEVPKLLYTIPVFHNPTGVTLSPRRRVRLVELAEEYGFPIVADEVYQLVAEPDRVPPPLRVQGGARILSLGSFSKILGPGLRIGWIECDAHQVGRLREDAVLRSGGGVSPMTGALVESALTLGLQDEFLVRIRQLYERRRRHMIGLLSRLLPEGVTMRMPEGGYYVWLQLPEDVDAAALVGRALAAGVGFRPGGIFTPDGSLANCLRICFTYYEEALLTTAVERLVPVLRDAVASSTRSGVGGTRHGQVAARAGEQVGQC